jgi:hypothetical protein
MEIKSFRLSHLRNGEHYKFHLKCSQLLSKITSPSGLGDIPKTYAALIAKEYEVYEVVRKSDLTEQLEDADLLRDTTYSGIVGTIRAALNHYDATVVKAAETLLPVIDQFGNVALLAYDDETAAVYKFGDLLMNKYEAEIVKLQIEKWVEILQDQNNAFDTLKNKRTLNNSQKPESNMKTERLLVDDAYRALTKRVNALAEVNGVAAYEPFIKELNQTIDEISLTLAQRRSRKVSEPNAPSIN